MEDRRKDDHRLTDDSIMVDALDDDGEIGQTEVAALVGLNTDLRREYIADCQSGVNRWNRILAIAGLPQRLCAAARRVQPQGRRVRRHRGDPARRERISADEWAAAQGRVAAHRRRQDARAVVDATGVRTRQDRRWIAPPRNGINGKPFDYDYVHLA